MQLLIVQTNLPKDFGDMKLVLDAVHAAVKQNPTDGKFGMARVSLPHKQPMGSSTINGAFRNLKSGHRMGIFGRSTVPRSSQHPQMLTSWYMGEIPGGYISTNKFFDTRDLDSEIILPAVRRTLASKKSDEFQVITASPGWKYEVATRKVFSTGPACMKCHKVDKPGSPIAIIGIARTTWPKAKK